MSYEQKSIKQYMLQPGYCDQPNLVFMRSTVYHPRFFRAVFLVIFSLLRMTLEMNFSCIGGSDVHQKSKEDEMLSPI